TIFLSLLHLPHSSTTESFTLYLHDALPICKVAVLGAGSWGMALSKVLAENGHDVKIWSRPSGIIEVNEINNHHTNKRYFEKTVFPESITATTELKEDIADRKVIVIVSTNIGIRKSKTLLKEHVL